MISKEQLKPLKDLTLLLVDDDVEMLEILSDRLSSYFYIVKTAHNGKEALDIYNTSHIDVVLTDYIMPIMNGHELCTEIRKDNLKIPLMVISSSTQKEQLLNCMLLNLTSYIEKPMDYDVLMSALLQLIEKVKNNHTLIENISKDIKYNIITKEITINNKTIPLTKGDILTLELLLKFKNEIVSTEQISNCFEDSKAKSEQAVTNIIYRLRSKLGKNIILTVSGFGYILKTS